MFDDRYGLNDAVLEGIKTKTRRIIPNCSGVRLSPFCISGIEDNHGYELKPKYHIGEVVAIAQSYKGAGLEPQTIIGLPIKGSKTKGVMQCEAQLAPGWTNKMFVRADLMPHHIRITNVRVERLQDISDEDCINEGVKVVESYAKRVDGTKKSLNYYLVPIFCKSGRVLTLSGSTPREVYAQLINRISGKGIWESNPFVFVYEFELVD